MKENSPTFILIIASLAMLTELIGIVMFLITSNIKYGILAMLAFGILLFIKYTNKNVFETEPHNSTDT